MTEFSFPLRPLFVQLSLLILLFIAGHIGSTSAAKWCPDAMCHASHEVLCNNKYLFIVGTGRSGSTSLLKTLNLLPGMHLCGETGLLPALRDMYRAVQGSGASSQQLLTLLLDQQRFFSQLHPPASSAPRPVLLGSKEVHLPLDQLDFLLQLFPCSRVVFSYRHDLAAQINSGFHKQERTPLQLLAEERQKMLRAHEVLGDSRTYLLALEEMDAGNLTALAGWLGYRDCEFERVGHYNFNNTYRKVRARPRVRGSCSNSLRAGS